jgi:hypothetical protein
MVYAGCAWMAASEEFIFRMNHTSKVLGRENNLTHGKNLGEVLETE